MAQGSGGLQGFSFSDNALSVSVGRTETLLLTLTAQDYSGETGRSITVTSSDTSIATATTPIIVTNQTSTPYTITVSGIAAGSATITASYTDSQNASWTATATVTVTDPTQVIVAESALEDIADAIRDKLGVATTYKPGDMAAAIASISGGGANLACGTITTAGEKTYTIQHNLGVLPKLFVCVSNNVNAYANSSNSYGSKYYICLTHMTAQNGSGILCQIQGSSSGTYYNNVSDSSLDSATIGSGYYFNMNTTTATIKSGYSSSVTLGNDQTYYWIAIDSIT